MEDDIMHIDGLPADLAEFIQEELRKGKYQSEVDLVTEAVGLLREREHRIEALRQEILPALGRLDRGEYTEYDEQGLREMMEDVKARGRKRLAERRSLTP